MTEPGHARLTRTQAAPAPGILHFGPGAFFRAHLAVYTDEAVAASGGDWGITAVSLRSAGIRDQLQPQGGVYTAVELRPEGRAATIVNAVREVLVAPEDPKAVITRIADPATRIVSLTITEKGYGFDPATGGLDRTNPDLAGSSAPVTAVGYLVAGLARRRHASGAGLTIMSCDNLPKNGHVLHQVVREFAQITDPPLVDWIDAHVSFPSTMVDRITPATTAADISLLEDQAGYCDKAMVVHEPFRQWVIEDDFAVGRPDWAAAGAELVADVAPYERMKLRCLNGAHSALAYLGGLAGHETMADAANDPPLQAMCRALWDRDILPTVPAPDGTDLRAYCDALMTRFQNRSIRHLTAQVAMDGSQKLPPRIVAPLAEHLDGGRLADGLCLILAGWMRYLEGKDEAGRDLPLSDPLGDDLRAILREADSPAAKVAALLEVDQVFPRGLAADPRIRDGILAAHDAIAAHGVQAAAIQYAERNA